MRRLPADTASSISKGVVKVAMPRQRTAAAQKAFTRQGTENPTTQTAAATGGVGGIGGYLGAAEGFATDANDAATGLAYFTYSVSAWDDGAVFAA